MKLCSKQEVGVKNKIRFLLLTLVLLSILVSSCSTPGDQPRTSSPGQKYLVVFVIDSCRPDYLPFSEIPNIKNLASEGTSYSNAWVGSLRNITPGVHTTLSTGAFPNKHKVICFMWKNPETGLLYWYTQWDDVQLGEFNDNIKATGVTSIGTLYKEKYPGARVAAISSGKFYAAAGLGADSADYILFCDSSAVSNPDSMSADKFVVSGVKGRLAPPDIMTDPELTRDKSSDLDEDIWVTDLALKMVEKVRPEVLLINLPQTDESGHWCMAINDPEKMGKVVSNADKQIGRVMDAYKKAGIYDNTIFVVTSDHGMTPTMHVIPQTPIYQLVKKAGTKAQDLAPEFYIYDSSKAADAAENIASAGIPGIKGAYYLSRKSDGSYAYLPTPTTEKLITGDLDKCFRYLSSTSASDTSNDILVPQAENWRYVIPLFSGKAQPSSHETVTWNNQHIPLIIAGPGVKKGISVDSPARIVDIAPTVLTLMGITPAKMDGVVLADCVEKATAKQIEAQNAVTQFLKPLSAALKAASESDLAENARQSGKPEK
jgi:arylsulfatase A-like enzyme